MKEFVGKIVKTIGGFFQGPEGEGSAKRLAAFVCLTIAAVYSLAIKPADPAMAIAWLGAGTALLGIGALTKS